MIAAIFAKLIGAPFIGALLKPIVGGLLDGYKAKLQNQTSREAIAADLAQRELSVQRTEIQAQTQLRIAQIGYWYEPEKLMGYTVAFYFAKLLIWDKVLGLGSTDPLAGWASTTANLIVMFYFGKEELRTSLGF